MVLGYILNRLKEPSTWRGIVIGAAALGAHWSPEHQEVVITFGIGLAGFLGMVLPDKWLK